MVGRLSQALLETTKTNNLRWAKSRDSYRRIVRAGFRQNGCIADFYF